MSELNFDEGIAMPVANLENKQLESEVRFTVIKEILIRKKGAVFFVGILCLQTTYIFNK